jgi:hypothetical protein
VRFTVVSWALLATACLAARPDAAETWHRCVAEVPESCAPAPDGPRSEVLQCPPPEWSLELVYYSEECGHHCRSPVRRVEVPLPPSDYHARVVEVPSCQYHSGNCFNLYSPEVWLAIPAGFEAIVRNALPEGVRTHWFNAKRHGAVLLSELIAHSQDGTHFLRSSSHPSWEAAESTLRQEFGCVQSPGPAA